MDFSDFFDFDFDEAGFWLEPDPILANVVASLVNRMGMPIGITLFIKGMVVSGTLVSEQEYLKRLTEVFTSVAKQTISPSDQEEVKMIEEAFDFTGMAEGPGLASIDDDSKRPVEDDEDIPAEDRQVPVVRFLHLQDFSVLSPHPPITFAGSNMSIVRIQLTAVDGWLLGHATPLDFGLDFDDNNDVPEVLH